MRSRPHLSSPCVADIARVREEEELETQIEEDHEDREDVASVSSSGGEAEGVDWGGDSDHDQDAECPEGGSEGTPGLGDVGSDVVSDVPMWTKAEVGDLTPGTPYFMEPRPKARVKDKSLPPSGRRNHGSVAECIGPRVAVPAWSPSGEGGVASAARCLSSTRPWVAVTLGADESTFAARIPRGFGRLD